MSIASLILGESGTGKSTSLRNLDPAQTLLIQTVKKPLPFKAAGWGHRSKTNPTGNIFVTDDSMKICALMKGTSKPIIVIDDWQYLLANEFMRRSEEVGFQKFSDIGRHGWDVLRTTSELPDHVRVYVLAHTQQDEMGHIKIKTIGKLLDEKLTIEGLFSIVMRTVVTNGNYLFATQNNGSDTVKTPIGLFADEFIPNDLAAVDAAVRDFYDVSTTTA